MLNSFQNVSEKQCEHLKADILDGPVPVVLLQKTNFNCLEKINAPSPVVNRNDCKSEPCQGPGMKLKYLPDAERKIFNARRKIINVLHTIIFGRPGCEEQNRKNILEFSGFSPQQKGFMTRPYGFLIRLRMRDLIEICDIFNMMKSGGKQRKIKEIIKFLHCPSLIKKWERKKKEKVIKKEEEVEIVTLSPVIPIIKNIPEKEQVRRRLIDFPKIRCIIERAPPSQLCELSDLLFVKPCESSEIHRKILNFTGFAFSENSMDMHFRKTLLHYMTFCMIKNIARLLDIHRWKCYSNRLDLSESILKFLQEMQTKELNEDGVVENDSDGQPVVKLDMDDLHDCDSNTKCGLPNCQGCRPETVSASATIMVKRHSENSYTWTDFNGNAPVTITTFHSDRLLTLEEFGRHPSEAQLEAKVREIIAQNERTMTLGSLITEVEHAYPDINLTYRIDFIKRIALEILHENQDE